MELKSNLKDVANANKATADALALKDSNAADAQDLVVASVAHSMSNNAILLAASEALKVTETSTLASATTLEASTKVTLDTKLAAKTASAALLISEMDTKNSTLLAWTIAKARSDIATTDYDAAVVTATAAASL